MIVTGAMKLNSKTDVCKNKQRYIAYWITWCELDIHVQSIPRSWSSFASKSADEIRTCNFFQFDLKVLVY